jgi:hypothetical protein
MQHLQEWKNQATAQSVVNRLNVFRCSLESDAGHCNHNSSFESTPLVWDTGASLGLTPFRADFFDYVEVSIPVKDITKTNYVIGIGTVIYKFQNDKEEDVFLPCIAYHLPTADIRLFSPQTYHQMHECHSSINSKQVVMHLKDHNIVIPIDSGPSNLPMVWDPSVSAEEQREIGLHFTSKLDFCDLPGMNTVFKVPSLNSTVDKVVQESWEDVWDTLICPCVGTDENINLSGPQKELLTWHWKLGVGMQRIQEMMREIKAVDDNGIETILPPVISPKFASTPCCPVPKCHSCELARQKQRSPQVKTSKPVPEKEGSLSRDKYEAGDFVSADQFIVNTPGRLFSGYGCEDDRNKFHGGTLFQDAATGIIWVECQVSLGAGETVMSKVRFEEWLWEMAAVEITHLHSDNGIFTADMFREDCKSKHQSQSFSGVGAKHQNSLAERAIQTVVYMARTFMVHVSLHWTERGVDDLALWGFAVKHAAWIYNRVPSRSSGLTPLELLTKTKADHKDLLRTHVWGCPVFVLDPKLQDGKKIPKWNRRSRLGQFLGFSDEHSSLVANVRNLSTGFVSPQYHVVFDDLFQTVFRSGDNDPVVDEICNNLFEYNRDVYAEDEFDSDGNLVYRPPPLDEVWLDESERRDRRDRLRRQREITEERERSNRLRIPAPTPPDGNTSIHDDDDDVGPVPSLTVVSDDDDSGDDSDDSSIPPTHQEGEIHASDGDPSEAEGDPGNNEPVQPPSPRYPRRNRKRKEPTIIDFTNRRHACSRNQQVPVRAYKCATARKRLKYRQRLNHRREESDRMLDEMELRDEVPSVEELMDSPLSRFITFAANSCGYSGTTKELIVNWVHPLFLKAKAEASKADNPNWWEAMKSPFADEYWKAAVKEIETLEKMDCWDVVDRPEGAHTIDSTWAFKIKRYPDGLIKKFKARFCVRGDQQVHGVDFFETYAPVVQWTTIRLMLILEFLLKLKSKQGDITAAFVHANVEEGENIYVEMPRGFKQKGKVLKLKKTLYGLRQSPRAFWLYLTEKMEACGMEQSTLDPCLFIGKKVMCICYVDDLIFWALDEADIDELGDQLISVGVALEQESDAAGFLGVRMEVDQTTGLMELKQTGLIDRVIETLGLDIGTTSGKFTPAEAKPLVKDSDGEPALGDFSYSSVVGMLLYLAGHTRPDIAYAVNCCARYMFCPKRSHELALKRIGRYLKATRDRGLVLNPTKELKISCYPDADFAGMYGHENPTDPSCVKSRTGFVITVANCPVLWQSKLQTETALSTMEAEVVALAHSCRELLPIMDMVSMLGEKVGLPVSDATMNVSIHEDNAGALVLAETLPPQFTPRSKHYAIKTIWFREQIVQRKIKLLKIDTVEQLGDLFTKGLPRATFEYLRRKLMGW